jgi:hypothetical protein
MSSAAHELASTFTWLAYSEREQREAQDLASTLGEKETRDELGVGAIRDALADRLFPGTSTIQTRARYFLFVPWIYQLIERERPGNSQRRADALERRLAAALKRSSDTAGLVGGRTLAVGRLPSSIYWNGLRILRIRRFTISLSDYHRWLDDPHRSTRVLVDDDGVALDGNASTVWWNLPEAPARFLDEACFRLTGEEAEFLVERAEAATPDRVTLLQLLFRHGRPEARADFPWLYPWRQLKVVIPVQVREELDVAEQFSLGHHGAALFFNLLIAEARDDAERQESYRQQIEEWRTNSVARLSEFDLNRLWALVPPQQIEARTRTFVERWFDLARVVGGGSVADDKRARELVRQREIRVKGRQRSRIANPFRVIWNGGSGSARLDYRWSASVQQIALDVAEGRGGA